MKSIVTIGTRGSRLALWQAEWIKSALIEQDPSLTVTLDVIKTRGDKILDVPLAKVGGKGLFVKEIEEALLDGRIDLAVHSMKDMPALIPEGLCIGAIPERGIPNDALIAHDDLPLSSLPEGARIGTSSLRRASQILHTRPDITILPLRGNLDTRIKKLENRQFDAIVLAAAGLERLHLEDKITEYIDLETLIPAVGQGALCIETRKQDPDIRAIVKKLDHFETNRVSLCERAFLKRLEGGCQVPMAAYGTIRDDILTVSGMVGEIDGSKMVKQTISGPVASAEQIGTELADRLIDMGAGEILERLIRELEANEK